MIAIVTQTGQASAWLVLVLFACGFIAIGFSVGMHFGIKQGRRVEQCCLLIALARAREAKLFDTAEDVFAALERLLDPEKKKPG